MIHVEDRGAGDRVRLITIDRPERRNALDHHALDGLLAAIDDTRARVDDGRRTRVLVLAGSGGHFCAGADLTGLEDTHFVALLHRVLAGLGTVAIPTIAAVEGAALGAGTQLAIACDLRTASGDAVFGIPAAKLGLMVDQWTVRRLVSVVGGGPARAMLMAAQTYRGEQAASLGFVHRSGGVAVALAWADELSMLAPLTIAGHKVGLNEAEAATDSTAAPTTPTYAEVFDRAWDSKDLVEGMAAFNERRSPVFEGD